MDESARHVPLLFCSHKQIIQPKSRPNTQSQTNDGNLCKFSWPSKKKKKAVSQTRLFKINENLIWDIICHNAHKIKHRLHWIWNEDISPPTCHCFSKQFRHLLFHDNKVCYFLFLSSCRHSLCLSHMNLSVGLTCPVAAGFWVGSES